MSKARVAAVDRRVEIVSGLGADDKKTQRVSQLRDVPYLVILGEPGSGKTTVLEFEADQCGAEIVKVRALLHGDVTQSGRLFLDALDEYRSDGHEKDKAHQLANAIRASGAQSWWLSCRAEDWRKEADVQAVKGTTHGQSVVVVQLLPLDYREAAEILVAFNESDPLAFLDHAESLGAVAFIENPLSLRLLHTAVHAEGRWPRTRFELFESAVWRLAHEDNSERRFDPRPSPHDLIKAADKANLMLLVTGGRALWRSSALPPDSAEGRSAYLATHDLGEDSGLIDSALDTALFRGEGEAFEPMHRTIAEFTAARALAKEVRGENGRAAFPLARALALVTGSDGRPPTELRGLFAWFAVHLFISGDREGALRLIEIDAPTVMSYGDAAAFDAHCRRSIFQGLTKDTPYFRSYQRGDTATGGLAGEDLAEDFAAVLRAPLDGTQQTYTVLDVLEKGAPVYSLKPLLREITLDPSRPDWVRRRAVGAWLNGLQDAARSRREIFDALASEPLSHSREDVRLQLAKGEMDPALTTEDVRSLISAFRDSGRSNTIGRSLWLKDELKKYPRPDLFDVPISDWLRKNSGQNYQSELNELLDEALAGVVRAHENLSANQLWRWIINASFWSFPRPGRHAQEAVREWLGSNVERELALLLGIKQELRSDEGLWMVVLYFIQATNRFPSSAVVRRILSMAAGNEAYGRSMLELLFHCAHGADIDVDLYWQIHARLVEEPEMASMARMMCVHKIEPWRLDDMKMRAERNKRLARRRAKDIATLMALLPDIRSAARPSVLQWGAEVYFRKKDDSQKEELAGVPALMADFNSEISAAIMAGWRRILTADFSWPSVESLGKIEADNNYYYVEFAVLAALDVVFDEGDLSPLEVIPPEVAISVLRRVDHVRFEERGRRLTAWAVNHLFRDSDVAAVVLTKFFQAALDAGATHLPLFEKLIRVDAAMAVMRKTLPVLLRKHPMAPIFGLRQALVFSAKVVCGEVLRELARDALSNPAVKGKSRRLWGFVDFALDPAKFDEPSVSLPDLKTMLKSFDLAIESDDLIDAFDVDDETHVPRRGMMILALGRFVSPSAEYPSGWRRSRESREGVVRRSIDILGASSVPSAGVWLARLSADPDLTAWRPLLRHARFERARLLRDQSFIHPAPGSVREAIAGKAPLNSADLRAIVREELLRLRSELRTSADSPWRHYWDNVGRRDVKPTPKVENACRDQLIVRLRDRMRPYGIADLPAERRHVEETRSDIALLSYAGRTFPVEIKRDSNAELWTAAATQLQNYANADTADGSGLYLIFWFAHPDSRLSSRQDGKPAPTSAEELEEMLISDLPEDLREQVDVIVFDVSDREARLGDRQRRQRQRR